MKGDPKHPRITPMRALDLLEAMALDHHKVNPEIQFTWERATDAFREHVRAELVRGRRKR